MLAAAANSAGNASILGTHECRATAALLLSLRMLALTLRAFILFPQQLQGASIAGREISITLGK